MSDGDFHFSGRRSNWMAALRVDLPVFDGFAVRSAVQQAESALLEALAADRAAKLSVKMDIRNAYSALEEATARLGVARKSVELADESLQLVQKQFAGGAATVTRYLEAELDLNMARTRATSAHYDRLVSLADVGRAVARYAKVTE